MEIEKKIIKVTDYRCFVCNMIANDRDLRDTYSGEIL
mgnify:CR=1 FL=1